MIAEHSQTPGITRHAVTCGWGGHDQASLHSTGGANVSPDVAGAQAAAQRGGGGGQRADAPAAPAAAAPPAPGAGTPPAGGPPAGFPPGPPPVAPKLLVFVLDGKAPLPAVAQ